MTRLIENCEFAPCDGNVCSPSSFDLDSWYVVHTHLRQEERADQNLRMWKIQTFTPKFREQYRNKITNEICHRIKPLFPRYIFARFNLSRLYHKIRFTRGVASIISFNNLPARVDDYIVTTIKERIAEDGFVKLDEKMIPGDKVEILSGPLANFTGIFECELNDSERIRILLQAVSYQTHVVVEKDEARKISNFQ